MKNYTNLTKPRSRTSKRKGKGIKLKWWYVLPVIAIVASAGYLIIRFSEAGTAKQQLASLRGGKFKLQGGIPGKPINVKGKSGSKVPVRYFAPDGPIGASIGDFGVIPNSGRRFNLTNKWICAKVYVSNKNGKPVTGKMTVKGRFNVLNPGIPIPSTPFSINDPNGVKSSEAFSTQYSGKDQWVYPCYYFTAKWFGQDFTYASVILYNNPTSKATSTPVAGVAEIWAQTSRPNYAPTPTYP
jgi:hypothetical protein